MDSATPFYDAGRSYEENYADGPFGVFADPAYPVEKSRKSYEFLGHTVALPFGIPAGPLLNGRFCEAAMRLGYAIATYKTVRGNPYPCHPFPNVIRVHGKTADIHPGETVTGDLDISAINVDRDGITNSFGVPSMDPGVWGPDVRRTVEQTPDGALLVLSFMGTKQEGMTPDDYVNDFARTCKLAAATGAKVLEVNFSCPNVGKEGLICNDVETSGHILEALGTARGNLPLLVKIGYFPAQAQDELRALIDVIHRYANGVAAINTVQAKVVTADGRQALPGSPVRLLSGTCGASIRWAGLEMVERIADIRTRNGWHDFTLLGVGGVTSPDDYYAYRKLGADAVQSATGAMWKPLLAQEIIGKENTNA